MPSSHSDHGRETRADPSRQDPAADDSGPTGTLRDSTGRGGGQRRRTAGFGPPQTGDTFAGFTIGERIGRGAMGLVYRARDAAGRDIALKVILAHQADEDGVARFVREGQAMAAIPAHPNVVRVLSAGKERGLPWLAMDFVEGVTLKDKIRQGPLPVEEARLIAHRLAEALVHIHGSGVVHRDLKPANVMIRAEDGEPLLTDFGLARIEGAQRLTLSGDVIGTPVYMSPEQVLGLKQEIDAQTDVWALGVLLYEMLAGQPPFLGANLTQMAQLITTTEPQPIRSVRGEVDRDLASAIDSALVKPKEHRLPDAAAFVAALDAVPDRRDSASRQSRSRTASFTSGASLPRARKRAIRAGLLLAVVGALVIGIGLFVRSRLRGVNVEALQTELTQLDREATKGLPGLLGAATSEAVVDQHAAALAALRAKSEEAGAPIDLSRVEAAVLRGRFELALRKRDWEAAEAASKQTPTPEARAILTARLALARERDVDQAALKALINVKQAEVVIAARVLLARSRALSDPAEALRLLQVRVPPQIAEAEGRRARLLLAIEQADPDAAAKLVPDVPAGFRRLAWSKAFRAVQAQTKATASGFQLPLGRALAVLGTLKHDANPRLFKAEGPGLAHACVERLVALETALLQPLHQSETGRRRLAMGEVVKLLVAIGASGLRPPWPERAMPSEKSKRLSVYQDLTNKLLFMQHRDANAHQVGQILRAYVQLDLPVPGGAFRAVMDQALRRLPDGPIKAYLEVRRRLSTNNRFSSKPRQKLNKLLEQRSAFGRHHCAFLMANASLWTGHDSTLQLSMATEAHRLDPNEDHTVFALIVALGRAGQREEMARLARPLEAQKHGSEAQAKRALAFGYAYLGDQEKVAFWLGSIRASDPQFTNPNWVRITTTEVQNVLRHVLRAKKERD